jgi:phosphoenolpyruvate carboxykinase (ATP)
MPIQPIGYLRNKTRAIDYMNLAPRLFVIDGYAGFDPKYRVNTRVICTRPYHALFMKQMLIRDSEPNLHKSFVDSNGPGFTVINGGESYADPNTEDVKTPTSINVNFKENEIVILGSQYAGEMKKGVFGVMHYLMPERGALSMHASANEGSDGTTTILFGLSGTGKTTLSADPHRSLIGDDEHVWTDDGIFNIEGGCYAKAIDLTEEKEPDIYRAIRYGAIVENIKYLEDKPRSIDYHNTDITENTRCCYPLEHIDGAKIPAMGGHPKNIIFLTCDANGVLPPVSKLTFDQAMYHFISGYTAKVAGTEMGIVEPVPSFSACFGEAFLPRHPYLYAKMLAEKVQKHGSNVWLVNTGWSGGKYGEGSRMSLKITRQIIDDIHSGELSKVEYERVPGFGLHIPKSCTGVDAKILNPVNTWADKAAFNAESKKLASAFAKNMQKYADQTPKEVIANGGPKLDEFN